MPTGTPIEEHEENFAVNVKRLREELGMSQNELATRVRDEGLPYVRQTTISRIEKGEQPVRMSEALALARVLEADIAAMVLPPVDLLLKMTLRTLLRAATDARAMAVEDLATFIRSVESMRDILTAEMVPDGREVREARALIERPTEDALDIAAEAMALAAKQRSTSTRNRAVKRHG